jgi:preprotein translocase subunit YajC
MSVEGTVVQFDPIMIVMLALVVVLIFFMFRNGKKRQAAQQEMQNNMRPGAEVMLQSGIYGTIEEVDEADNRVTVRSGTSTLVVHRNAVSQIISAADSVDEPATELAPDDDPAFGERVAGAESTGSDGTAAEAADDAAGDSAAGDEPKSEGDESGTSKS